MSLPESASSELASREAWAVQMHQRHIELGARVTEFGTFLMPQTVEYTPPPVNPFNNMPEVSKYSQQIQAQQSLHADSVRKAAAELEASYEDIAWVFRSGVEAGIRLGYIPAEVENRIDTTLRHTAVQQVDPLILWAEGQYDNETAIIKSTSTSREAMVETLVHELLHDSSGGTFRMKPDGAIVRERVGFATTKGQEVKRRMPITEIANTHLEQAVVHGNFDVLDPDARHDGASYYGIRKAMAIAIDRAGGLIDLRTICRASFEDNSSTIKTTDRREMVRQWRRAYGINGLRRFEQLCVAVEYAEENIRQQDQLDLLRNALYERIHAPIMDQDGSVLQAGYIDTDGLESEIVQHKLASATA